MPEALERGAVALGASALRVPLTGIGRYTSHLASELQRLLPRPPWLFYGSDWSREIRAPPPPAAKPPLASLKRAVPFGFEAGRFFEQRRFDAGLEGKDIALYHEPNFLAYRFAGPSVVTVHDLSWVRFPETHPADRVRIMNRTLPRVVSRAAEVIVDSEFVRGEVIAHYGLAPERVTAIPLGVSSDFRPREREACEGTLREWGLSFGEYVIAVGTLEPRKNLGAAIAAHRSLPAALRDRYPLVAAGIEGWGAAVEGVRRLGYLPQASLACLYAGARAFVYPSLYEGFGLPPLEAMACGVPVLVSRSASLPEVVGDAGILVDPRDEAAIRERLRELLEDDALHDRLRGQGLERAATFTWRRCAEQTLAVYRRAAARGA